MYRPTGGPPGVPVPNPFAPMPQLSSNPFGGARPLGSVPFTMSMSMGTPQMLGGPPVYSTFVTRPPGPPPGMTGLAGPPGMGLGLGRGVPIMNMGLGRGTGMPTGMGLGMGMGMGMPTGMGRGLPPILTRGMPQSAMGMPRMGMSGGMGTSLGASLGNVQLSDIDTQPSVTSFTDTVQAMHWSSQNDMAVFGTWAGDVALFHFDDGFSPGCNESATPLCDTGRIPVLGVLLSETDSSVLYTSRNEVHRTYLEESASAADAKPATGIKHAKSPIQVLKMTRESPQSVVTAAMDGSCHAWDLRDVKAPTATFGTASPLHSMDLLAHLCAVGDDDGTVSVYDLRNSSRAVTSFSVDGHIRSLAILSDLSTVVTTLSAGRFTCHSADDGGLLFEKESDRGPRISMSVNPEHGGQVAAMLNVVVADPRRGSLFAIGSGMNVYTIWDTDKQDRRLMRVFRKHGGDDDYGVTAMAYSSDGNKLLIACGADWRYDAPPTTNTPTIVYINSPGEDLYDGDLQDEF